MCSVSQRTSLVSNILQEIIDHFDQKENMQPVMALESLLMKSANGEDFDEIGVMSDWFFI